MTPRPEASPQDGRHVAARRPEGDERRLPGIAATLRHVHPHRRAHRIVDDVVHGPCRFQHRLAARPGEVLGDTYPRRALAFVLGVDVRVQEGNRDRAHALRPHERDGGLDLFWRDRARDVAVAVGALVGGDPQMPWDQRRPGDRPRARRS